MKIKLFFSALLSFVFCLLSSQVPQGFNYQAIARNSNGIPITNQVIPVRISIVTSLTGGTVIWQEDHSSVTADQYGLISLVVGTGTQSGGSAASFSAIDWSAQTLFLKTEVKYPGPGWTEMGTSQIWAVPYSLQAKNVGPLSKLGITGTTTDMEEALFEVKNQAGNTVFAVYNEGIRAYVGNGDAKGKKGGFSVGGYDATKGTTIYDLLTLNTDSARLYFDSKPNLKGKKGGFSVGGYDMTKGGTAVQNYLDVSNDSVRVYIDSNPLTKGKKGGFSVGGYDMTKGSPVQYLRVTGDSTRIVTSDTLKGFGVSNLKSGSTLGYLRLTPSNYLIGHQAGNHITNGLYNSIIGFKSGFSINTGNSNSFIGYKSGYSNTSGSFNVFLGNNAGFSNNGSMNTFIGYISGQNNTEGYYNSFLGDSSGYYNESGYDNTFIGARAGSLNIAGGFNTFLGAQAGYSNTASSYNTYLGAYAGYSDIATTWRNYATYNTFLGAYAGYSNNAPFNTFLGAYAGFSNTTGGANIMIGENAGRSNTTGNMNVMIGDKTGWSNTSGSYNTMIGGNAGLGNSVGNSNTMIGNQAGEENYTGSNNTMIGMGVGSSNITGNENTMLGYLAGLSNTEGSSNTIIGTSAGYMMSTSGNNTFVGYNAGYNTTGSDNVFIGNMAGYSETGSNNLYIANSSTSSPLIGGNFSPTPMVGINRMPTTYTLEVGGTIWANGATISAGATTWSDARYKTDVTLIDNALDDVLRMQGVKYDWNRSAYPQLNFPEGQQLGVIAQDIEKIIPQVVYTDPEGYKSVSYEKIVPVLIEAIKDQQKQIESTNQENQQLKLELDELKALVNTLIANQTAQVNKQ